MSKARKQTVSVCVVGGGTVGPPLAAFLARAGYQVTLVERRNGGFAGAGMVAAVFHASGCEYPLDTTRRTGRDCVLGGVTARLCLPKQVWTGVAGPNKPVRFLVSDASNRKNDLLNQFQKHRQVMCDTYHGLFERVRQAQSWSETEAAARLNGSPDRFIQQGSRADYADVEGITAGFHAAGAGNDTAAYAAVMEANLTRFGVIRQSGEVKEVTPHDGRGYSVRLDRGDPVKADVVVLTASHQNLGLVPRSEQPSRAYSVFVNRAVYVHLPVSLRYVGITFTLIGEDGGMFAVIRPPTEARPGLGMIYRPCVGNGSQFNTHDVRPSHASEDVQQVEMLLREANRNRMAAGGSIRGEMQRLYPDLSRAKVVGVVNRTVVSFDGNTREIRHGDHPHRHAPGLLSIVGTKWTNSITAAIEMFHAVEEEAVDLGLPSRDTAFPHALKKNQSLDVANEVGNLPGSHFDLREYTATAENVQRWHDRLFPFDRAAGSPHLPVFGGS